MMPAALALNPYFPALASAPAGLSFPPGAAGLRASRRFGVKGVWEEFKGS